MKSTPILLVLAGGFGTRLQSELPGCPKPLAPIGGIPFLSLLIELWRTAGVKNFVFLLHHQSEQIIMYLKDNEAGLLADCEWSTITEPEPLGTGGAVANAVHELSLHEDFLVANSDTWLDNFMGDLLSASAPALGILQVENTQRYGVVNIDNQGLVTGFIEKSRTQGLGWINAGSYHLQPNLFVDWNGAPFSLEHHLFPKLVEERRLHAVPLKSDFIDIGIPEDYQRFTQWIELGRSFPL
jgi:D-glycero-alpha-D-manno-heptose 1-phosphate guanylyltransferase